MNTTSTTSARPFPICPFDESNYEPMPQVEINPPNKFTDDCD